MLHDPYVGHTSSFRASDVLLWWHHVCFQAVLERAACLVFALGSVWEVLWVCVGYVLGVCWVRFGGVLES